MNFRSLGLVILFLSATGILRSQKLTFVPYGKLQCGYGSFTGYSELNYNLFTAGTNLEESKYIIP